MPELRYNPLLKDWTMVAEGRQARPVLPEDHCPFCPGSGKVPQSYDVLAYDNDFPPLMPDPPDPRSEGTALYPVLPAYGKCEVVLYSPDHGASLATLPLGHVRKLVDLWTERYAALRADPRVKYVLIFENRGAEVGVTIPHPHGQIYAYPYVPQKIRVESEAFRAHRQSAGRCLLCDINAEERGSGERLILESGTMLCYIPFFTDYPFGAMIASKAHRPDLTAFSEEEKTDLAAMLRAVVGGMDALYGRPFPYMMVLHQQPAAEDADSRDAHFHIEFYPPLRDRDKLKFLASSETGAWAPCNPLAVEDTAPLLREAVRKAIERMDA